MAANRSSAVMQQRKEPHNSLDDFPTPPWATRALIEFLKHIGARLGKTAREPAVNRGHMYHPLKEAFEAVDASDVHDYGMGFRTEDYLFGPNPETVDWTITNPPFRLAEEFIFRAGQTSRIGLAFIVRSAFLEGQGRYERLFSVMPPTYILQFSERVVMHKGCLSASGSSATAYCWIIFLTGESDKAPELHWVPPCRARLEQPGDYPSEPASGRGVDVPLFEGEAVND